MRSLLFIPGDDEKKLGKGVGAGADALILDLEDSVSAARKAAARQIAAQYIAATRARRRSGRASTCASMRSIRPCGRTISPASSARGPTASCCPRRARARTCTSCRSRCITPRSTPARRRGRRASSRIATEVPISLLQARYLRGLQRAAWRASPGVRRTSPPRSERRPIARRMAAGPRPTGWRATCACSPPSAANAQPIDTVFVNFRDEQGFRREASAAARDGFTGKMAIHPNQVAAINEIFTPKRRGGRARARDRRGCSPTTPTPASWPSPGTWSTAHVKGAERILARAKSATRG